MFPTNLTSLLFDLKILNNIWHVVDFPLVPVIILVFLE